MEVRRQLERRGTMERKGFRDHPEEPFGDWTGIFHGVLDGEV
jgi:hypothetical protein